MISVHAVYGVGDDGRPLGNPKFIRTRSTDAHVHRSCLPKFFMVWVEPVCSGCWLCSWFSSVGRFIIIVAFILAMQRKSGKDLQWWRSTPSTFSCWASSSRGRSVGWTGHWQKRCGELSNHIISVETVKWSLTHVLWLITSDCAPLSVFTHCLTHTTQSSYFYLLSHSLSVFCSLPLKPFTVGRWCIDSPLIRLPLRRGHGADLYPHHTTFPACLERRPSCTNNTWTYPPSCPPQQEEQSCTSSRISTQMLLWSLDIHAKSSLIWKLHSGTTLSSLNSLLKS